MRFEKLNHNNLKFLQSKGYNLLTSNSPTSVPTVIWFPEKVENLCEHLSTFDLLDPEANQEPSIMLIQFAIEYLSEDELEGELFNIAD
jgi:hypothetical protein